VQHFEQQIVQLGGGFRRPFFEPGVDQVIEQLGNVKRQKDVDERRQILPQRLVEELDVPQHGHAVKAERQVLLVHFLQFRNQARRLAAAGDRQRVRGGGRGRRWLRAGPDGPAQQRQQRESETAIDRLKLEFHDVPVKRPPPAPTSLYRRENERRWRNRGAYCPVGVQASAVSMRKTFNAKAQRFWKPGLAVLGVTGW
jgi:hypothetical protein